MNKTINFISRLPNLHFSNSQFRYFASGIKTFAEAILIGSSAGFFLPETLQLEKPIALNRFLYLFLIGLLIFLGGAIVEKRGNHD